MADDQLRLHDLLWDWHGFAMDHLQQHLRHHRAEFRRRLMNRRQRGVNILRQHDIVEAGDADRTSDDQAARVRLTQRAQRQEIVAGDDGRGRFGQFHESLRRLTASSLAKIGLDHELRVVAQAMSSQAFTRTLAGGDKLW